MVRWERSVVAVTGASGFLGRALTGALRQRGAAVRGLSRASRPSTAEVSWIQGDVSDADSVRRLVEGADVVVHAASYVHRRPRGAAEEAEVHATNVRGTAALLDAVLERARVPALVYVSSTAVYGGSPCPWTEDSPCRPLTPYGRTKLEAERLVLDRHPSAGVARPSSIVGDGAPGSLDTLERLLRWGMVPVIDGGVARKSFTHVSTVVAACLALAERSAAGEGQVVNVTDDQPCAVADLVRWRAAALGLKARLVSIPRRWIDGIARGADGLGVGVASRLVATLGDDAVAGNARMRALGVVPRPTAADWLAGGRP